VPVVRLQKLYFSKAKRPKEGEKMAEEIERLFEECISLNSEKIAIADRNYQAVD
jgi:cell division protein FtsB